MRARAQPRGRVAVDIPDRTGQAELRQSELVGSMQHLRAPTIGGSTVHNDFQAILAHQQNASAGCMRSVDIPLAFDDALVALGQNLGNQIKAIGIAWVRIFVLPYHCHVRLRIIRYGGYDIHADVMIGDKHRIVALERIIQQRFKVGDNPLVAAISAGPS